MTHVYMSTKKKKLILVGGKNSKIGRPKRRPIRPQLYGDFVNFAILKTEAITGNTSGKGQICVKDAMEINNSVD